MNHSVKEFLIIVAVGLIIGTSSYVTLSDQAAVLFGFLYIMAIPIVHELFEFGSSIAH